MSGEGEELSQDTCNATVCSLFLPVLLANCTLETFGGSKTSCRTQWPKLKKRGFEEKVLALQIVLNYPYQVFPKYSRKCVCLAQVLRNFLSFQRRPVIDHLSLQKLYMLT